MGICLPIAFTSGVAARKPVPIMSSIPEELSPSPQKFTSLEWERTDLFTNTPMRVRLLRANSNTGQFGLAFYAPKDFVKPDLIIYWVTGNSSIHEKLPDEAALLGSFSSSAILPLPATIKPGSGALVLYSLADHAIVDVSKPVTLLK